MRTEQEPTVEEVHSPMVDTIERHPAYGQIGAWRVHGTAYLYGSDFRHNGYVTIRISRSLLNRSLSRDWPSAREELIEVALTEAQWATFVSTLNRGDGVPCTIQWLPGQGHVPAIARPKSRVQQFKAEMLKTLAEARGLLARLRERIVAGKGGKESLSLLDMADRDVSSSVDFVAKSFGEHMETVVEQAKIEVHAYAQGVITRMGLDAAQRRGPFALEEDARSE